MSDDQDQAAEKWSQLRNWFIDRLSDALRDSPSTSSGKGMREAVALRFQELYEPSGVNLTPAQRKTLFQEVLDELVGFGPLEPLLRDDDISEIMVNGPNLVFIEKHGKLIETAVKFRDDNHALQIVDRIVRPLGRRVDRKSPRVDARLPDGSRVNVIIPPCALDGPTITIRKFSKKRLETSDLIRFDSLTANMAEFLKACVVGRLNIVVSGGTGSGKTTLLNILSGFIPGDERIVTIEDSAELQLQQRHVVRLETKPREEDSGEVAIRDLVINSLRMRPERIVVGECRGGEALDMLQAMNTGHDGSLTTAHANSPRDCLSRIETMCLMAGMEMPLKVIRTQIASAIDLIVQAERFKDGTRKISRITEVSNMEGDVITMQDIFSYEEAGVDPNSGKVLGKFTSTGLRPSVLPMLESQGVKVSMSLFNKER